MGCCFAVVRFEFSFVPHPPHPMLLGGFWSFASYAPRTHGWWPWIQPDAPRRAAAYGAQESVHIYLFITVYAHMHMYTEDVRIFLHNLEFGRRRPLINVVAFWDGTGATMCFNSPPAKWNILRDQKWVCAYLLKSRGGVFSSRKVGVVFDKGGQLLFLLLFFFHVGETYMELLD